ncbi:hypothetical protein [Frondihabitans australicus]|uniref:hypothetical protein n=1 Tax=Frondihabitans australicus TaxID=386892 RepID=UPI0011C3D88B|nr:hypothetical protein [Frondihabitans australicus]
MTVSGTRNTLASAKSLWSDCRKVVRYLSEEAPDLPGLGALRVEHAREFWADLTRKNSASAAAIIGNVNVVLGSDDSLDSGFLVELGRPRRQNRSANRDGLGKDLSDAEFERVKAAARSQVVDIRQRVRKGHRLIEAYRNDPEAVPAHERRLAALLTEFADTGFMPVLAPLGPDYQYNKGRMKFAAHISLVEADMMPLLALFCCLSGRNSEIVKELPFRHEIRDGVALSCKVVKRRSGKHSWNETAVWEIGRESRQLHEPGGFFLLIQELTSMARPHVDQDRLFLTWVNPYGKYRDGFRFAWSQGLDQIKMLWAHWAREQNLVNDDGGELVFDLNAVRTAFIRQRSRALGGHAPSSTFQNSLEVLFDNYLRGDPETIQWARNLVADTYRDVEVMIRAQHAKTFQATGGRIPSLDDDTSEGAPDPALRAYNSCADLLLGPVNPGEPCRASVLTCFRCPNALVGERHLPALVHLERDLRERSETMPIHDWWALFGQAWMALTEDVLTRFTDAQLNAAEEAADDFPPLEWLEDAA